MAVIGGAVIFKRTLVTDLVEKGFFKRCEILAGAAAPNTPTCHQIAVL